MIRILLFQLAAALELGLVIVEGVAPDAVSFLPLGGSHLTQVGVILGSCSVLLECSEVICIVYRRLKNNGKKNGMSRQHRG